MHFHSMAQHASLILIKLAIEHVNAFEEQKHIKNMEKVIKTLHVIIIFAL